MANTKAKISTLNMDAVFRAGSKANMYKSNLAVGSIYWCTDTGERFRYLGEEEGGWVFIDMVETPTPILPPGATIIGVIRYD